MSYNIPNLVFSDKRGNIYDHPTLKMCCRTNNFNIVPYESEIEELPKSAKLKYIENAKPLAYEPESAKIVEFDTGFPVYTSTPKGFLRTALPAFKKPENFNYIKDTYTAVGFLDEKFYFTAIRIDLLTSAITEDMSMRNILQKFQEKNPLIKHFSTLSKNIFEKIENLTPLGNELILDTSFIKENRSSDIAEMINILNENQKDLIITFSNLTQEDIISKISDLLTLVNKNENLTINIEPYIINIDTFKPILNSDIDLITINISSLNNKIAHDMLGFHQEYETYFNNAQKLIDISKRYKFEIVLNLNVLPGFTDIFSNIQSFVDFISTYNLNYIKLSNMENNFEIFFNTEHILQEEILGIRNMLKYIKKNYKTVKFGAFTRSKKYLYKDTGFPDLKRRRR